MNVKTAEKMSILPKIMSIANPEMISKWPKNGCQNFRKLLS